MSRKAMEMALEALEYFRNTGICEADTNAAREGIEALRAALAEAPTCKEGLQVEAVVKDSLTTEPVAWRIDDPHDFLGARLWFTVGEGLAMHAREDGCTVTPLYTHPPAPQPAELSDEEILALWQPPLEGNVQRPILGKNKILAFARAVLAHGRRG